MRRQGENGAVRVFKTKWFRRFARREGIADAPSEVSSMPTSAAA